MINLTARVAIPIVFGIAFGFFISCSSSEKLNSVNSEELSQQQIEQYIQELDHQLEKEPSNPVLLFNKGSLLAKLAQKFDDPSSRTPVYTEFRQILIKADDQFQQEEDQTGVEEINELLNVTWSNEHNSGVRLMQKDTSLVSENLRLAAEHFDNATRILPDSAISYEMQARAYYKLKQPGDAINTLVRARKNVDPLPSSLIEQLAFLYLERDDTDKAVDLYEEAQTISNQDLNLIHGLANAYISKNEHAKAVELLELLVQNKPESVVYAQSLGTELYYMAASRIDSIIALNRDESGGNISGIKEIDALLTRAENQFKESLKVNPDDYELERSFAHFYQNIASKFQKLLPYLSGNQYRQVNEKINSYLRSSIPLFLKLAEQNPQERNFTKNLYDIYSYLGMDDKAAETKEKLN